MLRLIDYIMINKNAHIIIRKLKITQTANTSSVTSIKSGLLLIAPHNCCHGIIIRWLGVVCSSYGTTSRVRWYFGRFSLQASGQKNRQTFLLKGRWWSTVDFNVFLNENWGNFFNYTNFDSKKVNRKIIYFTTFLQKWVKKKWMKRRILPLLKKMHAKEKK